MRDKRDRDEQKPFLDHLSVLVDRVIRDDLIASFIRALRAGTWMGNRFQDVWVGP
jgi:hypothetical protein